ncbi:MAG: GyrI-like domain-containing protein [Actinobacteria bacterium]|nr:GyrI-like domain-containing protein [Actinomycetota bacterium]
MGPVRLLTTGPFDAVALDTRGPYWKLSGPLARLKDHLVELGVNPVGRLIGIFYDDPGETPAEDCRFTLCYPVSGEHAQSVARAHGGAGPPHAAPAAEADRTTAPLERDVVSVRTFPASLVAAVEYRGPSADSPAAYEHLREWLAASDHLPAGAPRELYLAEPGTLGSGLMHVEVHQPLVAEG